MTSTNETMQSAVSYSASAGGLLVAHYADAIAIAQDMTVIVALLVGVVRLVYDGIRLVRFLRDRTIQ